MKKKLAVILIISLLIAAMLPANAALAVNHNIESGQVVDLSNPLYVHGDTIVIDTTEPVELTGGLGKDIKIECIVSNANITFNNVNFQFGEFGIAFYGGAGNKQHRFATYNGAKVKKAAFSDGNLVLSVLRGKYTLNIRAQK